MSRTFCVPAVLIAMSAVCLATETEHLGVQVLPVPGTVKIDGRTDDWDLTAGVFVCGDVESHREKLAVWCHVMHDAKNLYVLARWIDETPLNNPGSVKGDFPFAGDCLQFRTITAPGTRQERGQHFSAWRDRDGKDAIKVEQGLRFNEGVLDDAKTRGARQAFAVRADGKGYVQEISIPWSLLTRDGKALKAGGRLTMTVEPNFTVGAAGRHSIKDIFKPGSNIDRVFTFTAFRCWGTATLEARGKLSPRPVRLSDAREFPVRMERGVPVVNWTGLIRIKKLRGFEPVVFQMPRDGYVSLHVRNGEGAVVRQLLNCQFRAKGRHEVKWDALTTPWFRKPGEAVPKGRYTWHGIYHTGIGLRLRGWACNAGGAPWDNGPTTNWGGDHGVPVAAATDGRKVYLGWSGSEAGKALVACDLEGNVQWKHTRGAFGGAAFIAADGGCVYAVDGGQVVFCLNPRTGSYESWAGSEKSDVRIADLWEGPEKASLPDRVVGFDVKDGRAYLACAAPVFLRRHVPDWLKLLGRIKEEAAEGKQPSKTVWSKLDAPARSRIDGALKAGDLRHVEGRPFQYADARDVVGRLLNSLPRRQVEAAYGKLVVRARGNFVAVVDVKTGKVLRRMPMASPGRLKAVSGKLVYVLSAGKAVLALDPATGVARPVIQGLSNAVSVTTDEKGRIYVGTGEPDQQVKVFSPDGKALRAIGRRGGRPGLGPWVAAGMSQIAGMVVDARGRLWVAEALAHPKRFAVWDTADGKLLREYFGPTHYGASGGAIHPKDPDVMVGEGCEWRIDSRKGGHRCTGVFEHAIHNFARFCGGPGGRDYLAVTTTDHAGIKVFERLAPGNYALRATITRNRKEKKTAFWSDANGDQKRQDSEVATIGKDLQLGGYYTWSMNMTTDLTLYAGGPESLRIKVSRCTPCGAPVWDLASARPLPVVHGALASPGGRRLVSMNCGGSQFDTIRGFDVAGGRLLWEYPNQWSGVHGSHNAPPPGVGLLRGVFGFIGSAKLPDPPGDIFVMNSNVGEYHVLTGSGFYLTRLFQADPLKVRFPDKAVPGAILDNAPPGMGGEDFGGSMTQGADGRVYIEAGKTAAWNVEVVGLESVRGLPGSGGRLEISAAEVGEARTLRERYLQEAVGRRRLRAARKTVTFTGNLDADFKGAEIITYKKLDDATVRSACAWDDGHLYLGWQVRDKTPWVNAAKDWALMYVGGDTVDFQLGTDGKADRNRAEAASGDLRLSVGNFGGKPTAVLYRRASAAKKPRSFRSGVVKDYRMDFVDVVREAAIEVKLQPRARYVVEVAVPLGVLGFKPAEGMTLRGDFGVTHGGPGGRRTRLRTYWSNQHTGIVDDIVFELKMEPKHWGEITLSGGQ